MPLEPKVAGSLHVDYHDWKIGRGMTFTSREYISCDVLDFQLAKGLRFPSLLFIHAMGAGRQGFPIIFGQSCLKVDVCGPVPVIIALVQKF